VRAGVENRKITLETLLIIIVGVANGARGKREMDIYLQTYHIHQSVCSA